MHGRNLGGDEFCDISAVDTRQAGFETEKQQLVAAISSIRQNGKHPTVSLAAIAFTTASPALQGLLFLLQWVDVKKTAP